MKDIELLKDTLIRFLLEGQLILIDILFGFKQITIGFDLAVFVEEKDIGAIAKFVAEKLSVLDGIVGVATHFILKKYKIEGQITRPNEQNKREIIQA